VSEVESLKKEEGSMKHLPSIEALTADDDKRLLAELEIYDVREKLARVRALVARADHLLATVLACGENDDASVAAELDEDGHLIAAVLTRAG
jgi:hypothetical protein